MSGCVVKGCGRDAGSIWPVEVRIPTIDFSRIPEGGETVISDLVLEVDVCELHRDELASFAARLEFNRGAGAGAGL